LGIELVGVDATGRSDSSTESWCRNLMERNPGCGGRIQAEDRTGVPGNGLSLTIIV